MSYAAPQGLRLNLVMQANENQEQKEQPVPSDEQRSQAQPVKATTGATGAKATASTSGEPSKTIDPDLVKVCFSVLITENI